MKNIKSSRISISYGTLKNREISVPNFVSVRPTLSRIRNRILDWINPYIKQAICLDLFAGSGVLGIEMISRGARHVTFVDHNPKIIRNIEETVKLLSIESKKYQCISSLIPEEKSLERKKYNILLIDPPFFELSLSAILYNLHKIGCIQRKTIIYIESSRWNNIYEIKYIKQWKSLRSISTKNIRYSLFYKD